MLIFALTCLSFAFTASNSAPFITADWAGKEPQFTPGSLFWHTNQYTRCPIIYRAVLDIADKPVAIAGFRLNFSKYAYVFINGRQVSSYFQKDDNADTRILDVEMSNQLKPGRNVLVISAEGFSLNGCIVYDDGEIQHFVSDTKQWKAQKLPPLTMLEYEPFMESGFDDAEWFSVKTTDQKPVEVSDTELKEICNQQADKRMEQLDKDAQWRLKMLVEKGNAVIDWETYGWAGSERFPGWLRDAARQALDKPDKLGYLHNAAEALTRYIRLCDDATNLENHVIGIQALEKLEAFLGEDSPNTPNLLEKLEEVESFSMAAASLRDILRQMEQKIHEYQYPQAVAAAAKGDEIIKRLKHIINNLCFCLDNKFGWFDTNLLLDNSIANWGLHIDSPGSIFSSPLSPAAFITVREKKLVIKGWNTLQPLRVYNKPANLGPVCVWAVINGKVTGLRPGEDGVVYDSSRHGKLGENWAMLVSDLSAGGHLPIEFVFLQNPSRIMFKSGEKGTDEVSISFDNPEARFFILKPLKEWRGLLQEANVLKHDPVNEAEARQYIKQCRFWSRSLLNYPVTFSEVFVRDPQVKRGIICADVYNYLEQKDEWNTEPLRIAPLPPLATYGLMMQYPGLKVISEAQTIGSRGIWGDDISALNQNYIMYRVPIDPIKRFGGFTSYCFGGTDIGEPGSITEIETIKRTGSNSFRPQHNQTGERAMKTLLWCWERNIQNVFNTDEKWVPDVCEHFRRLAEQCKDYPPDAVAYDLLNEPETRDPAAYDALIRKITAAIREVDKTHLIYVEAFPPWGPSASPFPQAAFENLKPTGDKLTCYSFHDYEYRLPPRWPDEGRDIRNIMDRWIPAFKFSIDNQCPIHLGEFGGFEQTDQSVYDNPCALTLMMDYLKIFDQFGWHWHYYANRGTVRVRADGSLQDSYVQEAHRKYFARGTFNINR